MNQWNFRVINKSIYICINIYLDICKSRRISEHVPWCFLPARLPRKERHMLSRISRSFVFVLVCVCVCEKDNNIQQLTNNYIIIYKLIQPRVKLMRFYLWSREPSLWLITRCWLIMVSNHSSNMLKPY